MSVCQPREVIRPRSLTIRRERRRDRLGLGLLGCGLALLPWLVVLATSLPSQAVAAHWALAWVGLDAAEAAALITTGLLALRHDRRLAPAAAATAALLVVDAWFDTLTATSAGDLASALLMAGCAEVPLAVLCARLALRATAARQS